MQNQARSGPRSNSYILKCRIRPNPEQAGFTKTNGYHTHRHRLKTKHNATSRGYTQRHVNGARHYAITQNKSSKLKDKKTLYLNIYVDLRSWIKRSQYCGLKNLFKVTSHFKRTAITLWTTPPVCRAEYCHAELAVYKHLILGGFKTPGSTLLNYSHTYRYNDRETT